MQDEKTTVILGPLIEDRDDSSPPFYTSLNIHDKVQMSFGFKGLPQSYAKVCYG